MIEREKERQRQKERKRVLWFIDKYEPKFLFYLLMILIKINLSEDATKMFFSICM